MGLYLPQRWRQQPTVAVAVNRASPLANGLVLVFTPHLGVPLLNNAKSSSDSGTSTTGAFGRGVDYSGTAQTVFPNPAPYVWNGGLTFAALLDLDTATNASCLFSHATTSNGIGGGLDIRLGNSPTDTRITVTRSNSTDFSQCAPSGNVITAPNNSNIVLVTGSTDLAVLPNGRVNRTPTTYVENHSAIGTMTVTTNSVFVGRREDGAGQLDGRIYLQCLWNRILATSEQMAFEDNPWQIFAPIPARRYFFSAAAAPTATGQYFDKSLNVLAWF